MTRLEGETKIDASDDVRGGSAGTKTYRVGTLSYTFRALLVMMLWLLGGDFCFYLMENVAQSVLPLMLGQLVAPNWVIAMFMVTIPSLLNATVCPWISFWSDRFRSPLGRRIPFILYTVPFLCLFLILTGLAPYLADWLKEIGLIRETRMTALVMIGVFTVGFQFFNMFVSSVYYYLFNDIVPHEFLGRFLALFRAVGTVAGGIFFWFVLPKAETHFMHIFIGSALLYGVAFLIICRKIKEGEYPPPPSLKDGDSFWLGIKAFFVESFSYRFYWIFYLFVAFWSVSLTNGVFLVFFARSVGLSLEQFGMYVGTSAAISAILLLPCGVLSDKYHPLRTLLVAATAQTVVSALPLVFLIFPIPPQQAFMIWCVVFGISVPTMALFIASELPTYMQILPRQRFGQFSAATALVRSVATLFAGLLCGVLIDAIQQSNLKASSAYLYLPIWSVVFQGLSAGCLWLLYREWKRRGGDKNYVPPDV